MRKTLIWALGLILLGSCTKQAGEGGLASIKGKVVKELRLVLTNPETAISSYPAPDEEVWIIYGENTSPDDRYRTNYDGEFEIQYLRPGEYTIYVYSEDTTGAANTSPNRMPIIRTVNIDGRRDVIDLGDLVIYERP